MDLALGVAVAGPVARLALLESNTGGQGVVDESVVDLANDPIARLTETVVGTDRLLADQSHRLVATRLCWSDHAQAGELRQALEDSGVHNVAAVPEFEALQALVRSLSGGRGQRTSAVLQLDAETAMLSIVNGGEHATPVATQPFDGSDAATTAGVLLGRLGEQSAAAEEVYLVGSATDLTGIAQQLQETSALPVAVPDDPDFAIARGAALAGVTTAFGYPVADVTTAAPAFAPDATTAAPAFAPDATMAAPAFIPDATMAAPGVRTGRDDGGRRRAGWRRHHGVR